MEIETASIKAEAEAMLHAAEKAARAEEEEDDDYATEADDHGPTPSPTEDETVALHTAEKAAWAEDEEDDGDYLPEADDNEADAREFRDTWNRLFSDVYGCFEDTSE
jgi:hypothetical protein